jgi:hypothetical protein
MKAEFYCPNGHPLSINVVMPPGAGRMYCPECGWKDSDDGEPTPIPPEDQPEMKA